MSSEESRADGAVADDEPRDSEGSDTGGGPELGGDGDRGSSASDGSDVEADDRRERADRDDSEPDEGHADAASVDPARATSRWLPRPLAVGLPFTEPPSGPEGLSRGEVFELLSNERRRHVIRYLQAHDGSGELGDMATQVAAWEHDVDPEQVDSTERKRAYTTLQQSHLPKMDKMGAVDYDSNSGRVEATAALDAVDIYLEIVPGGELAWKEYYLALSLVSVALVVVVAVGGVYPFSLLEPIVWAAVIACAFLVSAAAHVYLDRSIVLGEAN